MIEHASPDPLYRQVADDLLNAISSQYQPGDRLPSESELVAKYGVSRITIRRSLEYLADQGVVVRKQGKGTYISTPRIHQDLQQMDGFYASLVSQGVEPETRLLQFRLVPASSDLKGLLRTDEDLLFLQRLYLIQEEPLALMYSYIRSSLAENITKEAAERHPTNTLLTEFAGLEIDRADLSIRVQPANHEVAELLGVSVGTGLLAVNRLTFCKPTGNGTSDGPSKYTLLYLRSDLYEFGLTIKGGVSLTDGIQTFKHPH